MRRGIVLGMILALGGLAALKAQPPAQVTRVIEVQLKDRTTGEYVHLGIQRCRTHHFGSSHGPLRQQ